MKSNQRLFYLLFSLVCAFAIAFSTTGCKKVEGCTNPDAVNYNPEATKNDGSCEIIPEVVVIDNGGGTGTVTWTKDNIYILSGLVYVNPGQELTIEAGTVIKGRTGQGASAAALIVTRGAKIHANGTESEPIIFTSELDDINDLDDIPTGTRGLWGGVAVLGAATINNPAGEEQMEGISPNEVRGKFGGQNDQDTSGTLRYLSIRYAGIDIGNLSELKGLLLAGVGSGTTVDHIEIFFNKDDGFAFDGGTVNAKYLAAMYCQDDGFDFDLGYRGKLQHIFSLHEDIRGDYGGEHDGGDDPVESQPFAHPVIYNATYIGRGQDEAWGAVVFKDNSGGEYHNSIFTEYPRGMFVEITTESEHSYDRLLADEITMAGNVFWNIAGNNPDSIFTTLVGNGVDSVEAEQALAYVISHYTLGANLNFDPQFASIATTPGNGLNPTPGSPQALSGGVTSQDAWFDPVTYRGAFGGTNWLRNWTAMEELGWL